MFFLNLAIRLALLLIVLSLIACQPHRGESDIEIVCEMSPLIGAWHHLNSTDKITFFDDCNGNTQVNQGFFTFEFKTKTQSIIFDLSKGPVVTPMGEVEECGYLISGDILDLLCSGETFSFERM